MLDSVLFVGTRFQVLFHSAPAVLFTFPSRYCFTIGHQVVFSLWRWSSQFPTRFHVPRGTLDTDMLYCFSHTGLLPSMVQAFHPVILLNSRVTCVSPQPPILKKYEVWASPRSLATTSGITIVFFSCRYLDVSVPCVSLYYAMYSHNSTWAFTPSGFPHSEICGSEAICASPQLIAACHVLRRLLMPRHSPCALKSLTYIFFTRVADPISSLFQ